VSGALRRNSPPETQVAMELAPSGQLIVTAAGDVYGPDTPENHDLARRIRACINACEGLTTEDLENGLIRDLCRTVMQVAPLLQAQDRELRNRAA
jgi:hypothetical protein